VWPGDSTADHHVRTGKEEEALRPLTYIEHSHGIRREEKPSSKQECLSQGDSITKVTMAVTNGSVGRTQLESLHLRRVPLRNTLKKVGGRIKTGV